MFFFIRFEKTWFMKQIFFSVSFLLIISFSFSQHNYTGMMMDNVVSSNLASFNPSSIVDSKTKFAFTSGINYNSNSNFFSKNYAPYNSYSGGFVDGTKGKYIASNKAGFQKESFDIDIINLKFEINHKNAIAYSLRGRAYSNRSGIDQIWAENSVNNYKNNIINEAISFKDYAYNQMEFTEHGFTYAGVVFDKNTSLLKIGGTFKVLNGLSSRHFYVNDGSMVFTDSINATVDISNLNADYGRSVFDNQDFFKSIGFGFDVGVTYEIRPNFDKQYYQMDGNSKNVRYDINKYKVKFGASITDLGSITYLKDSEFQNFTNPNVAVAMSDIYENISLGDGKFKAINELLQETGTNSANQNQEMKFNLPITVHLNADYYVKKNFYVSYNISLPFSSAEDKIKISNTYIQTITPRIEKSNFSALIPLSHQGNGKFYIGFAGRMVINQMTMYAGSNNISIIYGQKSSLTRNFFIGTTINMPYRLPSDIDNDKISDAKDICPDDFGLFEFQGCPDTDGDGIPDKEDFCIYHKGTRETNGCPDSDGDGIIDMNDMCPNVAGLGVHYGCPDRDFDGVIDMVDQCPDVPGIELNNGCPFENPGCCTDDDGDGVTNKLDKCPDIAGSIYNEGCPIDSLNINKINLQEQKVIFDPNNTKEQIKVLKNKDTIQNYITNVEDMRKITSNKNIIKDHNVYFNHDQATLTQKELDMFDQFFALTTYDESFSLIVIGHTDRDGSLDYNLILSKKRAETVKRKLLEYGYPESKIKLYYFGEEKSLKKGSYTEEMKKMDRRVEIKIVRN
jgi:outer membrane protein OmpA-like peptidoglycan-associated protein